MFHTGIKNAINETVYILNSSKNNHLKIIKPRVPLFRGLPKIHKELMPIRPLVNFTSAPAYKLAKFLEKLLRSDININNGHSLKNSLELIDFTL